MLCNNCNIEMRLDKYENNIFNFKCVKCGQIIQKSEKDLREDYKKVVKEAK